MPDQARALFGLAPVGADRPEVVSTGPRHPEGGHRTGRSATVRTHGSAHVAICGSRAPDTEAGVIDAAVSCLARLVMSREYKVSHGPVGVGIEVMTYIAALHTCHDPGEDFIRIIEHLIGNDPGVPRD